MWQRSVVALVLAAVGSFAGARPAAAAPTGVVISARVAPSGTSVTISGAGCATDVHVIASGFLFPGPPVVPFDQTVTPAGDGTWQLNVAMPAVPSYVVATCDGVSSLPIVIAPSDVSGGGLSPASVSTTDVVISTSPLVNGSSFSVFDLAGHLIASSQVVGGVGSVSVPRSLGPAVLMAVALRQQDLGIALPYVPLSLRVQLPLPSTTTIQVDPAVTTVGQGVVASGSCVGTARLIVSGRVAGWYDHAPIFVDITPPVDSTGAWSATFPMPALPSVASLTCTNATVTEGASQLISPSAGALPSLVPVISGDEIKVTLPPELLTDNVHAYTASGVPVALSITTEGSSVVARMQLADRPGRIVILGIESLGENAEALQNSRVQAWTVDVPGSGASGSPSSDPAASPTTRGDLPPTDAAGVGRGSVAPTVAMLLVLFLSGLTGVAAARIGARPPRR